MLGLTSVEKPSINEYINILATWYRDCISKECPASGLGAGVLRVLARSQRQAGECWLIVQRTCVNLTHVLLDTRSIYIQQLFIFYIITYIFQYPW